MNVASANAAAPPLAGKHLYLAGYRGSGKSSVGRLLAKHLGRTWIDCDDQIEAAAGCSIRELFAEQGEAGFRALEQATLAEIAAQPPAVVSLGGGAVLRAENRQQIRQSGVCVWLRVDVDTVLQRIAADATTAERRPALTTLPQREEIAKLLADRGPLYEQVADLQLDTSGRTIAEIAERILQKLGHAPAGASLQSDGK